MGTYVTESGLKRKTLQECRAEIENALKQAFGPSFETSVDSPNGLLISQLALGFSNAWELAFEVFTSRDPAQAVGVSLDFAAALNGITRQSAMACSVNAVAFTLDSSATIPQGATAVRTRGNLDFTLDSSVTVSRSACEKLMIEDDGSQKNTDYVFHFTFGDVTLNNSTEQSNLYRLRQLIIVAGGKAEFYGGRLAVWVDGSTVGITGQLPDDFNIYAGNTGSFTAVTEGLQTCDIGELDAVRGSVTGFDAVYNFVVGVPGRDAETDDELRVRRAIYAQSIKSCGTDPSIEAHLLNDVPGVTAASVTSNRDMTTDNEGRPPKSFEALVGGGDDYAVATCIWKNQPSGIQPYGNTSVEIVDEDGDRQMISFSRPRAKYLWVRITYRLYDEETFPGVETLKAAILQWADIEYNIGKDVIPDRIYQGIYGVPGVGQCSIEVALTENLTDSPNYVTDTIPVSSTDYAVLSTDRITLTPAT